MRSMIFFSMVLLGCLFAAAENHLPISFNEEADQLDILVDGELFASYIFNDPETLRPYFSAVHAPGGIQVTRNHPPDAELDINNVDHATFHPGIWLAFGDLGGEDFWRNKAVVRHVRFEKAPQNGIRGSFSVVNSYETLDDSRIICEEICTYTFTATSSERWIFIDTTFETHLPDITFGDQEEMGLGVRLATGLTVRHGSGTIVNSYADLDEAGTWGKQADWCVYSGVIDDSRVGILLAPAPYNFRASWFHNRDYGLMVANPFGLKSMTAPSDNTVSPDATALQEDQVFSLGYAVCVFNTLTENHADYSEFYAHYKNQIASLTSMGKD